MKYQVVNPATGQLEREYPTATDAGISAVLERAERGYASWRRSPKAERAGILRQVAQLYADRADALRADETLRGLRTLLGRSSNCR